jgi:hypothetical protein
MRSNTDSITDTLSILPDGRRATGVGRAMGRLSRS